MPHITIEYSANVAEHHDVQALVDVVHAAALEHGLPQLDALRTRAAERPVYRIADGDPLHAFVAISVRIGPGRDDDTKSTFIEHVLDAAVVQLRSGEGEPADEGSGDGKSGDAADSSERPLAIAWSIELTEIDPQFRINRNFVRTRLQAQQEVS